MSDLAVVAAVVAVGGLLNLGLVLGSLRVTAALVAALRRRGVRPIHPRAAGAALARHELTYLSLNMATSLGIIGLTAWLWTRGAVVVRPEAPGVLAFAGELVLYLACFDAYTHAVHRWMHTRWLYRHVHAVHHRSRAPSALTAYSFHPAEWALLGLHFPLALTLVDYHLVTLAVIFVLQGLMNTLPHCGYEYAPRGWYAHPVSRLFLTAFFHEQHHQRVTCNYGTFTTLWDRLLGSMPADFERQFAAMKDRCCGRDGQTITHGENVRCFTSSPARVISSRRGSR